MKYTCEMIRDLIPLCAESLCSEDSRAAVGEHIQSCAECRKLYEALPGAPQPENAPIPDESKTFFKVARRIAKSRRLNRILGIVLGVLLIPIIILSIGSILRVDEFPSFETVMQSMAVRKIAKSIAEGDFQPYLDSLYESGITRGWKSYNQEDNEALKEKDLAMLNETYERELGGRRLKTLWVHTTYLGHSFSGLNPAITYSEATAKYDNGTLIKLGFYRDEYGNYFCGGYGGGAVAVNSKAEEALGIALFWAGSHKSEYMPFVEALFENPIVSDSRLDMMENRFAPQYKERLHESFTAFLADYVITEAVISEAHYDKEQNEICYEVMLTAEDDEGSAVLQTRFFESIDGLIPPEPDACTVYADGCTPELEEALIQLFGA